MRECRYCGRKSERVCMNTREMEDASDTPLCYAALMFAGGGEYTHNQRQSEELYRRTQERSRR